MTEFDVVISGGRVVDGTVDAEPTRADVGIIGESIAEIGDLSERARKTTVDAADRIVSPGFIDTHTHIEMASLSGHNDGLAAVEQGVTTTFVGADGFGWVGLPEEERRRWWEDTAAIYGRPPEPIPAWESPDEFLAELREASAHSVVPLVPHGNVRAAVMGASDQPAGPAEIARMRSIIESWMDAGAVGMASGLDYLPGRWATTDEMVAMCEIVSARGGVYASHVRNNDLGRADGWREAAEIGQRAQIPVRIAHERLDELGAELLAEVSSIADITLDSYLYPAGCTSLAFHVPKEALADGVGALSARIAADSRFASELAAHLQARMTGNPGQQALIAATTSGRYEGQTLSALAEQQGITVGEVAVQLLRDEMPCALLVYVWQSADATWDETVARTVNDPHTLIASDGVYLGSCAHPRGFGTYPRIIGDLSRDTSTVSLGRVIHKMSGKPAEAYGLTDRGVVAVGRRADLVVFDQATIGSAATTANPRVAPTGIDHVFVAGRRAAPARR